MVTQCSPTRAGPRTLASSGCEMRKSTGSWCRYLKMGVDNREKKGSVAITCPPDFNLLAARFTKFKRVFQMVQHVRERNDIEATVFDRFQFVDLVAVKRKVEIIEVKDVACYDV